MIMAVLRPGSGRHPVVLKQSANEIQLFGWVRDPMRILSSGAMFDPLAFPEATMAIAWRRDVDAVLSEAKAQGRHVLLDFTAAPT